MNQESLPDRKRRRRRETGLQESTRPTPESVLIKVGRSGDWMPVEELRHTLLEEARKNHDLSIDLDGVTHLDASAL